MAERKKRIGTDYKGVFFYQDGSDKVFYIRYRPEPGKRIEEPVGRTTKGMTPAKANLILADRVRGKELSNQARREAAEAAKREEDAKPTIARLWALYAESLLKDKPSIRSDDYVFQKNIATTSIAKKTPGELVTLDLERVKSGLLKTLSPQSTKYIMAFIRRAINYGVRMGFCPRPDESKLHFSFPKIDNLRTENMSRDQMADYLSALDEEPDQNAAGLIRLALSTGMRRGALFALKWEDIDFENGFIVLQGESAKSKKTERIPLSVAARLVLERIERTAGSPYVFPGRNRGKRTDFARVSRRVRDKAGLGKDFRPLHGLRHTFASWMASTGAVDLYTLQKLLTHNSPQMTQRYAHLADEALKRAAAVAGDIFSDVAGGNSETAKVLPFKKASAE
ncbi:MAG: site-specific integrase [Desulfovibrio sp.]|jgi:integrase|nr:site-specific integrase [Desulfovibrio sp.]